MPSWDVVNGAPLQRKLAEGGLSLLVTIISTLIRIHSMTAQFAKHSQGVQCYVAMSDRLSFSTGSGGAYGTSLP